MRVAVIGCGSMGLKHINNISEMGHEIIACDNNPGKLESIKAAHDNLKCYQDYKELAANEELDAVVIATDTAYHQQIASFFASRKVSYFSEIPISDSMRGLQALVETTIKNDVVSMVGMIWRFHPGIKKIKELVGEGVVGKVNTVSVYGGDYLPDWHPGAPYKVEYSALRSAGGGVIVTNVSGVDYLRHLFGEAERAFAVYDSISHIKISAEDFFMGIIQFQNGVYAQIYSDFFQRPVEHRIEIIGDEGKIRWNFDKDAVFVYPFKEGPAASWVEHAYKFNGYNELYREEIDHFLAAVQNKRETCVPIEDNLKTVAVADALKRAHLEQRMINVSNLLWEDHSL